MEGWRQWRLGGETTSDKQKSRRTDLTSTGLLMEAFTPVIGTFMRSLAFPLGPAWPAVRRKSKIVRLLVRGHRRREGCPGCAHRVLVRSGAPAPRKRQRRFLASPLQSTVPRPGRSLRDDGSPALPEASICYGRHAVRWRVPILRGEEE